MATGKNPNRVEAVSRRRPRADGRLVVGALRFANHRAQTGMVATNRANRDAHGCSDSEQGLCRNEADH
jgi:hypothetical protein